jgi:thymidylate kinase
VIVVLLGPDGCGKSSVLDRLQIDLSDAFSEIRILHLRPRMGRGGVWQGGVWLGPPVVDPHGMPPRGLLPSIAKLLFLLADYSTIYPWKWSTRARRASRLILFDRYYHDLLVDPRRYRYGAPMWLARGIGHLVPRPDLWVLLDAPPEVIHSRKREVPIAETARQRRVYLELVSRQRNAHVVDATRPLEQVTRAVARLIRDGGRERGAVPA